MDEDNKVWFVPKNFVAGKYRCVIEVIRTENDNCRVFIRSEVGNSDWGDKDDLESLMDRADISYLLNSKSGSLSFERAVEFMSKQTAFERV